MVKNFLLASLIIAAFSGCQVSVNDNFIDKVDQECSSQPKSGCTIALKDVTKFQWDKMYLLGSWTNTDSITNVIGFKYNGDDVPDDNTRMLFTYGNKVVHEEDFASFDDRNHSTIEFDNAKDSIPYHFLVSQAIFTIKKIKAENGCKECFDYILTTAKKPIN